LHQNYPNPFNPKTVISWQLAVGSQVEISIINLLGQKVSTLVSEKLNAGLHQVEWDATGFASGVYFYRLVTNSTMLQDRLILMK
jgi:flagellar hook assembly protein FlgD